MVFLIYHPLHVITDSKKVFYLVLFHILFYLVYLFSAIVFTAVLTKKFIFSKKDGNYALRIHIKCTMLCRYLALLDDPDAERGAGLETALSFRLKLALAAGFAPELASCARCGEAEHLTGFSSPPRRMPSAPAARRALSRSPRRGTGSWSRRSPSRWPRLRRPRPRRYARRSGR